MGKKFQTPTIGGIRKVIRVPDATASGTTISGLEGQTITIAQLQALLGLSVPAGSQTGTIAPAGGAGAPAALVVGPGLSGGGSLIGAVPLNLVAPAPVFLFGDGAGDDGQPGPPGINGIIGVNGAPGAAIYLSAEPGEDGFPAIPGGPGPTGAIGATGGQQFGAYWISLAGGLTTSNAVERVMNAAGTIKEVIIVTKGGVGSCTIAIWKAALSSHYPPTVADDITGGTNVVLTSGITHDDSTLSGWTTSFAQDDVFLFTLLSTSVFTTVGIFLRI